MNEKIDFFMDEKEFKTRILKKIDEEIRVNTTNLMFVVDVMKPCEKTAKNIMTGETMTGKTIDEACKDCLKTYTCKFYSDYIKNISKMNAWIKRSAEAMQRYQRFLKWLRNTLRSNLPYSIETEKKIDEEIKDNTRKLEKMQSVLQPCSKLFLYVLQGKEGCPISVLCTTCTRTTMCYFKKSYSKDEGIEYWLHESFKAMWVYQRFLKWVKAVARGNQSSVFG